MHIVARLYALAEKHHTSGYDAAYVEVAARLRLPLATKDAAMRRAARHEGVELFAE